MLHLLDLLFFLKLSVAVVVNLDCPLAGLEMPLGVFMRVFPEEINREQDLP